MAMASSPAVKVSITASHDGGNIEVVSQTEPEISSSGRTAKCTVTVHIKPDVYTELEKVAHMQYFSFRAFVSGLRRPGPGRDDGGGVESLAVRYVLANAHAASYPKAWEGTTVFESSGGLDPSDDAAWRRNPSTPYADGALVWSRVHDANGSTFFSYWPPYTYDRHLKLVADCSAVIAAATGGGAVGAYDPVVESLGRTLQGREMECVSIGNGKLTAYVQHRQHPGESMASFFAEGLLHRLLGVGADGELDEATKRVLDRYRLHIIPCMCPDGAVLGHLRTNSAGANLNREWATVRDGYEAPTRERSPEVEAVLSKMDETGVDFFLDVHGDEELPFVFVSGAEKTPVWGDRIEALHGYFVARYQRANSDVQKEIGYPPPDSEEEAMKYMNVASNQVSVRFDCLGLTLEMPFKDCQTNPDPARGFSPDRAKQLGRSLVETLVDVHPYLRAEGEFWSAFSEEDKYVIPTDKFK